MRKLIPFVMVLFFTIQLNAQVSTYTFTPVSGSFTQVSGGTAVDDIEDDDVLSLPINIGFNFVFDGVTYTQVVASSNGWLSFNTGVTDAGFANNLTSGVQRALVAPLWDDLDGFDGPGIASYVVTGSSPNRVFTFEWRNWEWDYFSDVAVISFQAKLYETTNVIEFVYRSEAGAEDVFSGASIGIAGVPTGAGNFQSLNNSSAAPTASSVTETVNILTKPATGQIYRWTPLATFPNDAGIISPFGTFCSGLQNVTATLRNFGTTTLTSAVVNWTVNGVPQPVFNFAGSLAPGASTIITLGTFTFAPATNYTLSATSSLPNGVADGNTGNDNFTSGILQTGLSGTYTIGGGGNFTTLTAAVNAANNYGLCGATVFSLINATYPSETYPITINTLTGASATNTLTIKPTLANTVFSGNTTTYILNINGGDYVTIDGSINNTANSVCPASSATRDLTFTQTNTSTSAGIVWLSNSVSNDAVTNCTVKNCIIQGNSSTTTLLALGVGGNSLGTPSTANNATINFINNDVRAALFGIYCGGTSAVSKNQNLVVNQNFLNNTGANAIGVAGITAVFYNNIGIAGNTVGNIVNTASSDVVGINVGYGVTSGFNTTATGIANANSNVLIANNTIGVIAQTNTFSAAGIALGNTITGTSVIANNMIYGVAANGTSGDCSGGIFVGGGTAAVSVYNNTVSMQGTIGGASSATQISTCLAVPTSTAPTALNIANNIFSNTQIGNTGATLRLASIALGYSSPYTGTLSNYNDLNSAGAGPGTYTVGVTGGLLGTNRVSMPAWRTETGGDANSLNLLPVFASTTDLHLATTNCALDNKGTNVGITADIDCQPKDAVTPDIGADEFSSAASNVLFNIATLTITDVRTVTTTEIFRTSTCQRFAVLQSNGASPVSGSVTARVYKYGSVSTFNAEPFLQRVIDITPATNAATATGRVTLYYTQLEFTDFNTASGAWPDLPTGPADATGIGNLRITKYSGSPNSSPPQPNQYSAGTSTYINPPDADIVWNAADSRWEVTIDVVGFSGFYVHTNASYALPITLNYLNGTKQGTNHLLNWKVTCNTSPKATLVLERSASNTGGFSAINTLDVTAARCATPFNYTDANPLLGMNYYRLKMIDADGKVTYSNTIAILNAVKGFEVLNIAPNPIIADGSFKLNVTSAKAERLQTVITDMQGRVVANQLITLAAGYNSIDMNIGKLAAGTYNLYGTNSEGEKSKVIRLVKQ